MQQFFVILALFVRFCGLLRVSQWTTASEISVTWNHVALYKCLWSVGQRQYYYKSDGSVQCFAARRTCFRLLLGNQCKDIRLQDLLLLCGDIEVNPGPMNTRHTHAWNQGMIDQNFTYGSEIKKLLHEKKNIGCSDGCPAVDMHYNLDNSNSTQVFEIIY